MTQWGERAKEKGSQWRLPVDNQNGKEGSHNDEPEPEEDVGLLVDDVLRKDAHRVVSADGSGSTEFVERALGNTREDVDHGIKALLLIRIGKRQHCNGNERIAWLRCGYE